MGWWIMSCVAYGNNSKLPVANAFTSKPARAMLCTAPCTESVGDNRAASASD